MASDEWIFPALCDTKAVCEFQYTNLQITCDVLGATTSVM